MGGWMAGTNVHAKVGRDHRDRGTIASIRRARSHGWWMRVGWTSVRRFFDRSWIARIQQQAEGHLNSCKSSYADVRTKPNLEVESDVGERIIKRRTFAGHVAASRVSGTVRESFLRVTTSQRLSSQGWHQPTHRPCRFRPR